MRPRWNYAVFLFGKWSQFLVGLLEGIWRFHKMGLPQLIHLRRGFSTKRRPSNARLGYDLGLGNRKISIPSFSGSILSSTTMDYQGAKPMIQPSWTYLFFPLMFVFGTSQKEGTLRFFYQTWLTGRSPIGQPWISSQKYGGWTLKCWYPLVI